MVRDASIGKIPFDIVQCSYTKLIDLQNSNRINDGTLYFVLDTKQILLGKNTGESIELIPMGKSTGIIFGKKEDIDHNDINAEITFTLDQLEESFQDSYPQPNDLIFNKDGCFYRVTSIEGENIKTLRLTVAGSGGGGSFGGDGGGNVSGASTDFSFSIISPTEIYHTISAEDEIEIQYTFTDFYKSNGKPSGDGKIQFIVNDVITTVSTKQSTADQPVLSMKIPKSILTINHENNVLIRCCNRFGAYDTSSDYQFFIKVIDLQFIPKNSSANRIIFTEQSSIDFSFETSGLDCNKQVIAHLYNCNENSIVGNYSSEIFTKTTEKSSLKIDKLSYGVYTLKIWAESPDNNLHTKKITYKIICAKESSNSEKDYVNKEHIPLFTSFLMPNDKNEYQFSQGENLKFYYMYYDPRESDKLGLDVSEYKTGMLEFTITNDNGTTYKTEKITKNLKSKEYGHIDINNYPVGKNVGLLLEYWFYKYGGAKDELTSALGKDNYTATKTNARQHIEVLETEVDNNTIVPANLLFNLNAFGRKNGDDLGPTWSNNGVTTTFSNMYWTDEGNGWTRDNNGETALKLSGESKATVNFQPFKTEGSESEINATTKGLTLELEFMIKDINNRNSIAIDCKGINTAGCTISADTAIFSSDQANILDCKYSDGVKTKISFVIDPIMQEDKPTNRFMYIYLNGVLSRVCQYDPDATFSQGENVCNISLGSSDCTLYVYTIRCYDRALGHQEILRNYIADIQNQTNKTIVDYNNKIYSGGELSFSEIKKRIPVMVIKNKKEGESLPDSKTSHTQVSVDFYHNEKSQLNFSNQEAFMNVQGTSSLEYPVKNYTLLFHDKQKIDVDKIDTRLYCLKADFAESTSTHNTQHGNYIHTLYDYNTPAQQENDSCRTTIYGYPIVLFHEIEQGKYKFIGKYNFNYDRYSLEAYGLGDVVINENKKYNYELIPKDVECWELADNVDGAMFLISFDEMLAEEVRMDEEIWEERASISGDKEVLRDMYTWVYSTNQNQATNLSLDVLGVPEEKRYGYDVDSSDFRLEKFKNEFEDYFDKNACVFYYIYTTVALMIDQRGKNMNLCKWGQDGKWAPWFYDNDSCFGLNNQGALVFDYSTEDTDADVYSAGRSVLWNNFRQAFPGEIKKSYDKLRNGMTAENFINYFITRGSDRWSESIYNEDAKLKYIDPYGNRDDLNKALGTGEEHLKYFITNRIKYYDGKWEYDDGQSHLTLRANRPILKDVSADFEGQGLNSNEGISRALIVYLNSNEFLNDTRVNISLNDIQINSQKLGEFIQEGFDSGEFFGEGHLSFLSKSIGFDPKFNVISLYDMVKTGSKYIYNKNNITKELSEEYYNNFVNQNIFELIVLDGDASIITSDFEVNRTKNTLKAVPPNSIVQLTAGSDTYLNVIYGTNNNETLKSSAIKAKTGETKEFRGPLNLPTNFNIKIPIADKISSLGDLSKLYLGDFQVNTASNLKVLQLGNDTPGYFNIYLKSLNISNLSILSYLDITNCIELKNTINLSTCPNLSEVKALGTNIESFTFSPTGYINKLLLPKSFKHLKLTNQLKLKYYNKDNELNGLYIEKDDTGKFNNISQILIEGCPEINTLNLLQDIIDNDYSIERFVRITDVDWSFNDNGQFLMDLISDTSKIKGLTSAGAVPLNPIPPQLFGKCHFNSINGATYEILQKKFPNLELTYDKLTSEVSFWIGGKYDNKTYESGEYAHYQLEYNKDAEITQDLYNVILKIKNGDEFVDATNSLKLNYFKTTNDKYTCIQKVEFIADLTDIAIEIAPRQIIESSNSNPGIAQDPVVNGIISPPIRLPSDRYTYDTFLGWSIAPNSAQDAGMLRSIKGNTKFYAAFTKKIKSYTVKFYNNPENKPDLSNNFVSEISVNYGEKPWWNYDTSPKYPGDQNNDYQFDHWEPSIDQPILKDTILVAKYLFTGLTKMRLVERAISSYPANNNIKNVGDYAFYNCNRLQSITLPIVETIGENAFKKCIVLKEIVVGTDVCDLKNINAFEETPIATGEGIIYVPHDRVEFYQKQNTWGHYKNQIKSINERGEN